VNTFIVLLRGINVGGNNILPMKELVSLLEVIGCESVKTYIQSGNIVLDSSDGKNQLSGKIESIIFKAKGFRVSTLVLTLKDFQKAVDANSYSTENGKFLHLLFLSKTPPSPDLSILEAYKSATENYELSGHVLYLYAPDGIGRSKLATKIEKAMGVPTTARNWNTVQKLVALAST
jgi:uncharacterized protein (DUF1697 family)